MNKKMQNLKEMEYYSKFNLVGEVLLKLKKKYPNNETLKDAISAMTEIGFFATEMMQAQYFYEKSLESYRSDKHRAIERARRVEDEIKKLREKWEI
jgi:hypothetical protein